MAAAALATSAVAAAPGTFNFAFPLPKPDTGVFYELDATVKIPSGTTVTSTGSPWVLNTTNQPNLPSYIRAAAAVVPAGTGAWHIFIAINAPKGLVKGRRLSAAETDTTLNVSIQETPPFSNWTTQVKKENEDACHLVTAAVIGVKDPLAGAAYLILIGATPSEAKTIVGYVKQDCK